jgi:hypothetical protein
MRQIWPLALLVSLGAHGVLLAGAQVIWGPRPLPAQKPPEARLELATQPVAASSADATPAAGEAATATPVSGQRLGGTTIPVSAARPSRPAFATATAIPVAGKTVAAAAPSGPATLPIPPDPVQMTPESVAGDNLLRVSLPASPTPPIPPAFAPAPSVPPASLAATAGTLSGPSALPVAVDAVQMTAEPASGQRAGAAALPQSAAAVRPAASAPAAALPIAADAVAADQPAGLPAPPLSPDLTPAPAAAPASQAAPPLPPPSEHGTASLAWSGDHGTLDPLSLAAIQAFMQPGDIASADANSGRLRDGIAATLAAVPCARLQTSFDPATGSIELRGHLPEDRLRAPVIAALQAHVGGDLPVRDRLQLLPRPQCQILGAIADAGLPQSTEQETNPRVVGPDTFVRNYDLRAGQQLVFDMTAPDYPAVIYVDYFDMAGNVLHMQPNDQVPLVLSPPGSTLSVGQAAPGVPALKLIVGPPFGQEIAVAFATSVPLYDGLRPTVEPAEPYLRFLSAAIAEARAAAPDFKGEWVYFLMTTAP